MKTLIKLLSLLLCVALVFAFAGCANNSKNKDTSSVTASETANEAADFDALAAEIYGVRAGTTGATLRAEEAAKTLVEYVKACGGQSDNGAFEQLLNEWLEKNADVSKADFKECLDAVSAAAIDADENLETDVSFLNVINGFAAALADEAEDDTADFDTLAAEIYGVRAGTTGATLRAEEAAKTLVEYVKACGGQSDNGAFEQLLKEWLEKNADVSKDDFKECLDAVSAAAIDADENLETDVSFLNVINGFAAALADEAEDDTADFDALAAEIYGVRAGTTGATLRAEEAAKTLVEYVKACGGQSDNGAFEQLLKEWLEKNADVSKDDFKECLDTVSAAAIDADEELETDVSFLNVINGFAAALEK